MNRLSEESSAYLQKSAAQKIDWHPWSDSAFDLARQQDRPVFLSSGAVWCHWCHVMAGECFYDNEISDILNNHFVNIKLDRDERPDIDRRYQMAVAAMGQGGGWPLSIFLTPDKEPFFGGTYFPPEDKLGRPGLKKVLKAVLDLYKSQRPEISEYSDKLLNALKPAPASSGDITPSLLHEAVEDILSAFDQKNGGFGSAPKFPMPGATDFLINRYVMTGDTSVESAVKKTLDSMACGGFYDQVGGGFHRYSTDQAWIIPHFEKMADDNAWLLRNYLSAYAVMGDEFYRETAEGIIFFMREVLSHPDGCFYSSQDADVTPDDEGGYFTWTDDDFKRVLTDAEYELMAMYLMHEAGSMHHDASKKVLFVQMGAEEIAEKTGRHISDIVRTIHAAEEKLLHERNRRETPFIDKTIYTSTNGMLVSVFLHGYRILKDSSLKEFSLKSLEKTLAMHFINNELYHTGSVRAFLDDYVYLADALVSAYEVTGTASYIQSADEVMGICIDKLWDREDGGVFHTDDHHLGIGVKAIEDMPQPSANSLAVKTLLKLHLITGNNLYHQYAEQALKIFSTRAGDIGVHAGYYFSALDAYRHPLKLTVHSLPSSELSEAAVLSYSPFSTIVYDEDRGHIIPCMKDRCYKPVDTPEGVREFLRTGQYLRDAD
jgi:uncharacterized protein YyaL (SSP411 family)